MELSRSFDGKESGYPASLTSSDFGEFPKISRQSVLQTRKQCCGILQDHVFKAGRLYFFDIAAQA